VTQPYPTTAEHVHALIERRERERSDLEFKRALPTKDRNGDIAVDLAAMANNGGGVLLYGVGEDNGRAKSLHPLDLNSTTERVASIGRASVDEPMTIDDFHEIRLEDDGVGVLVVVVGALPRRPYFVNGTAYGRSGPVNVRLGRAEIARLFAAGGRAFLEEFGGQHQSAARVNAAADGLQAIAALDAALPHIDYRFAFLGGNVPGYVQERRRRAEHAIDELRRVEVASAPLFGRDLEREWSALRKHAEDASHVHGSHGRLGSDEAMTAARALEKHAHTVRRALVELVEADEGGRQSKS